MPPPPRTAALVTLKDIARAAGVHYSTVSLALRDHGRIPATTRTRIQQFAKKLGYRRDPVLLALSTRRAGRPAPPPPRLVFLTNRRDPASFYNTAHMSAFLAGAAEQARALGYPCELMLVGDRKVSAARIARRLAAAGPVGLILGAFLPGWRQLRLDWTRYAVVKIDSAFMAPSAPLVTHDQMQAVRSTYRHLHALGYRHIGLAVGRGDETNTRDLFTAGRLVETEALGLAPVPPLHFRHGESDAAIARRLRTWVDRHRVDAVVSNWLSIRELLAAAGLRAPAHVACACLSLNAPDPTLAGIVQNHLWVGRQAAETVALLLQRGTPGATTLPSATYIAGQWHDGATAPRCAPAAAP